MGLGLSPQKTLLVPDWKADHVYLVQFPRCGSIVSTSPFGIKLETWLRFAGLPYTNISNQLTIGSAKGQIPFIELNGRQFADSQAIIEMLTEKYNVKLTEKMSDLEKAQARALQVYIEESLQRIVVYDRSRDCSWFATSDGFIDNISGVKKWAFQHLLVGRVQAGLRNILQAQGMGRNSPDEVDEIAKKDLSTLSTILGNKDYLFGHTPNHVDAILFGTLVSLLDPPLNSTVIKPFIEGTTTNLHDYVKRIKSKYWPDYDKLCKELLMNATDGAATSPPTSE